MTASLDSSFVENLLSMSEGDVLDFKREQYPLTNDDEKGELIKDLLAFANGWRMSDAFILVGVAERTGARAEVLGLTKHLKDDLHPLVDDVLQREGPVLIAWEHTLIPDLIGLLPQAPKVPGKWPGQRFDIVWVLDRTSSDWTFSQVPQMLLEGDSPENIT